MNGEPAYRIRSMTHAYGGRSVLDISELDLPSGEICVVAGANGSGKTTLLRILALLLRPSSGSVWLNGVEAANSVDIHRLRRQVTLVHQGPALFSTTVRKNISYGLRATGCTGNGASEAVDAALAQFELTGVAERHARELSGGEIQRVVLARAMVLSTPVLLLDEPTSFLDDDVRPLALKALREANASRAVSILIATHDLSAVSSFANRIVTLDAGRIRDVVTSAGQPAVRPGGRND